MADNQTQKEIVLCKMFTGNYWEDENNLGYETINMFLPDKSTGESYIYLPACGDYEFSKHADLPYILLTRGVEKNGGKQKIQVIGIAEIDEYVLKDHYKSLNNEDKYICIGGGKKFVGLVNLITILGKEELKNSSEISDDNISKLMKKYKLENDSSNLGYLRLEIKMGIRKNSLKKELSWKELINWYNNSCQDNSKIKGINELPQYSNKEKYKEAKDVIDSFLLEKFGENVNNKKENEKNFLFAEILGRKVNAVNITREVLKNDLLKAHKRAIILLKISVKQKSLAETISYGGVSLDGLFKNNEFANENLNLFITFKVRDLRLFKDDQPVFLQNYDESKDGYINSTNLSSTSQTTFITIDKKIEELVENLKRKPCKEKKEMTLDGASLDSKKEDSFLTIIKKEYDELVYSNMLAYFFRKSPDFLTYILSNLKDKNGKEIISNIDNDNVIIHSSVDAYRDETEDDFTVEREKKNIDILIRLKDRAVVIENKIKSSINGERHNVYGELVQTQLGKYYTYVENNYPATQDKENVYLIFTPNYNIIDTNKFTEEICDGKEVKISQIYKVIYYNQLHELCKVCLNKKYFKGLDEEYYIEFVKALSKHIEDKDINYFDEMKKRLLRVQNKKIIK